MIKKFHNIQWQDSTQPHADPIGRKVYCFDRFVITFHASTSKCGPLKRYKITIEQGVKSDLQSAPQLSWTFGGFRPDGLVRQGAALHDMGYSTKGWQRTNYTSIICVTDNESVTLSRLACDQIYRASYIYCAENAPIPSKKDVRLAKVGYRFLRMGGWMFFGKERLNKDF